MAGENNAAGGPVPAQPTRRVQHNGWTAARREAFLARLAATCNVKGSCREVGMSFEGAYQLRARDAMFAAQWEEALAQGYRTVESRVLSHVLSVTEGGEGGGDGKPVPFDMDRALQLLTYHARMNNRADVPRRGRKPGAESAQPDYLKVLASLERKLTAMEKRIGRGK